MSRFVRGSGIALVLGAALLVLVNVVLTPMLPVGVDEATTRTSTPYMLRLSTAILSMLLLLFGSIGPHLSQRDRAGSFGAAAFGVLFTGTALGVAVEWANVFVMRPLAYISPAALAPLDDALLLNVGFASAFGLFILGWILMSISLFRTRVVPRWIPASIVAGLVSIAALGAAFGLTGAIIGNVIFGGGLMALGREIAVGSEVARAPAPTDTSGSGPA